MEEETRNMTFSQRPLKCPKCGRELQFADETCPFCGKNIKKYMFVRRHKWLILVAAVALIWCFLNYKEIFREINVFYYRAAEQFDNKKLPQYDIEYYEVPGEVFLFRYERDSGWNEFYRNVPEEDRELVRDAASVMESCFGNSVQSYLEEMTEKGYEEKEALRALDAFQIDFNRQARIAIKGLFASRGYSRQSAAEELREMGFLEEEIDYAISTCGADYKKQARIYLQSWLGMTPLSPEQAEERLREEGFLEEEISWAFQNTEVDWNLMAYLTGREYLRISYADKTDLRAKLLNDGFTAEQARYAAEKLHAK